MSALPRFSDIDLFGYCKGIVHFECLFPPRADETGTPAVRANGIFSRHTAFSCAHRQRLAAPPIRPSGRFPLSKSKLKCGFGHFMPICLLRATTRVSCKSRLVELS
jgi:hypothetical protein